ncbi:hypothetical protein [Flammeovirga aprica]|uniref:Uncharacterized protein n=1 Tax=Flammeovirga aprica JL-4 TaxID=694437 RepID=A0A7X9RUF1_9BACT|nr:hypothetical protein [Flammeovirga aprica]NME68903.1 hypothetical protein [Flammeovirga aprica JL-4]
MLYLLYLTLPIITFFSPNEKVKKNTSKVLFEVINYDAQQLNGLELEIYDNKRLIARLNTRNITSISLPKEKYEFILYYCDETFKVKKEIIAQRHHLVFVVGEKNCKENLLFSK